MYCTQYTLYSVLLRIAGIFLLPKKLWLIFRGMKKKKKKFEKQNGLLKKLRFSTPSILKFFFLQKFHKFLAMCNNTLYSVHYQKCIANKQPTTQLSQYSSLISHDIYYYWFQNGLKALLKSLFDFCTPSRGPLHIEGAIKKFWGFEATFSDIELRKWANFTLSRLCFS